MLASLVLLTFAETTFGEVLSPITTVRFQVEKPPFYINDNASDYQNMTDLIETGGKQYIYYRSYQKDPLFGNDRICPYLMRRQEKTVQPLRLIMGYLRPNGSELRFRRNAEYQMSENYTVANMLWIQGGTRHNTTRRYTLVFTDNSTCSVVRSDLHNGCEIWVPKSALSLGPSPCCNFLYQLLCGKQQYQMYNASCPTDEMLTPLSSSEESSSEDGSEDDASEKEI
uniref:Putative salivary secreted protein n=1 Tax=Ixodes scapularis TaxID=6945 RepID=Q4PMI6_IXOSC|nr:putative salivary secreted protein [Ixodes scapularis]